MSGRTRTTSADADAEAAAQDLTQLRAPEEFRRAIIKDPYASTYRFDFDAARGVDPITADQLHLGGSPVPRNGYYFDLDGHVIDWYRAGNAFPKHSPATESGGRFFFLTDRRDATTSDLLYIILRAGWEGNVLEVHVR